MKVSVSGHNMKVGSSLSEYVEHELEARVKKYFERAIEATVTFSKEAHLFLVDVHVNDGTGQHDIIKSRGKAADVYAAFEQASERAEKQLRRYKRRIKNHHQEKQSEAIFNAMATKYVLSNDGQEVTDEEDNPLIIAEKQMTIEKMSVSDAVMRMDLMHLPAVMFVNSKTGKVNMVYHREDGNISWVDSNILAEFETAASKAA